MAIRSSAVLLPIVERLGIEVSAVWPLYRPECLVKLNGVEERQVLEWPEHLSFEDRPEIDLLQTTVVELECQRVRTDDVEVLYAMDGVTHEWPLTQRNGNEPKRTRLDVRARSFTPSLDARMSLTTRTADSDATARRSCS